MSASPSTYSSVRRGPAALVLAIAAGASLGLCSCQSGPRISGDMDAFESNQQATTPPVRSIPDLGEREYLRQGWTGERPVVGGGYHQPVDGGRY